MANLSSSIAILEHDAQLADLNRQLLALAHEILSIEHTIHHYESKILPMHKRQLEEKKQEQAHLEAKVGERRGSIMAPLHHEVQKARAEMDAAHDERRRMEIRLRLVEAELQAHKIAAAPPPPPPSILLPEAKLAPPPEPKLPEPEAQEEAPSPVVEAIRAHDDDDVLEEGEHPFN